MKGLTHFASGVAAATFFPEAVHMAAENQSFVLVLGGIFGILPDTLDFKFARFFERWDHDVDPPENIDPADLARRIAAAVTQAHESGKPTTLKLHTVKLAADRFRQYKMRFDRKKQEVVVEVGPVVSMSKVPFPGSEPEGERVGRAPLPCPVLQEYEEETYIDIFDGPSFTFEKTGDGRVAAHFIAWHRKWSHSLTLAALFGLLLWLAAGPVHGLVAGTAFAVHVLEDQIGHMGSNLFYPFTKYRKLGLHWMKSGDAIPNFMFVWLSCVLVLYNLNRFRPTPVWNASFEIFFGLAFVVPMLAIMAVGALFRRFEGGRVAQPFAREKTDETADEADEAVE